MPGGGREELAMSGASPSLPAWGAERTPTAWMVRMRMLASCIVAVVGGLRQVWVVGKLMLRIVAKVN